MPWFTICMIAPSMPWVLSAKIPKVTKPMWLTLEYAISFFRSACAKAMYAPYRIATSESATIIGVNVAVASGSIGSIKRMNP